jgi:hypothetical protein
MGDILQFLNFGTFAVGMLAGAAGVVSLIIISRFVISHWRSVVLCAAVCGGLGLLLNGLK